MWANTSVRSAGTQRSDSCDFLTPKPPLRILPAESATPPFCRGTPYFAARVAAGRMWWDLAGACYFLIPQDSSSKLQKWLTSDSRRGSPLASPASARGRVSMLLDHDKGCGIRAVRIVGWRNKIRQAIRKEGSTGARDEIDSGRMLGMLF